VYGDTNIPCALFVILIATILSSPLQKINRSRQKFIDGVEVDSASSSRAHQVLGGSHDCRRPKLYKTSFGDTLSHSSVSLACASAGMGKGEGYLPPRNVVGLKCFVH